MFLRMRLNGLLTNWLILVVQVQNLLMQVCDETSNIAEVQLKVQLFVLVPEPLLFYLGSGRGCIALILMSHLMCYPFSLGNWRVLYGFYIPLSDV